MLLNINSVSDQPTVDLFLLQDIKYCNFRCNCTFVPIIVLDVDLISRAKTKCFDFLRIIHKLSIYLLGKKES